MWDQIGVLCMDYDFVHIEKNWFIELKPHVCYNVVDEEEPQIAV